MKKNLTPWPIDNKHILEDFTYDIHGDDCVERTNNGIVRQAFYEDDVLWELIYQFGDNWFEIIRRSEMINVNRSADNLKKKVIALANEENGLYVKIKKDTLGVIVAEFMKEVEE